MEIDNILSDLHTSLNKKFKDTNQKTYILGNEDSPINVSKFISTGCTPLDVAIANRPNGGVPLGKFTVLEGLNSAGKSLLLATILANNQKQGGISILIDNEFAVDPTFYSAIGLNMNKLIYSNIEYIEDMLSATEEIILQIRKKDPDIPIVIGWDSIAGAKSKAQGESGYDKDGYATEKAIILSQKLPKIQPLLSRHNVAVVATQQLRSNVNRTTPFEEKYVPASGGMALSYYSRVVIRLSRIGKIQAGVGKSKIIVGVRIKATITKNHIGPAYRSAEFEIYFDSGIDDSKACLDILKFYNVVKTSGAWTSWNEDLELPGVDIESKFQLKQWKDWMSDPDFKKIVSEKISEVSIMKYKGFKDKDDETEIVNDDGNIEEELENEDEK